jgi:hypothetical protein
MFVWKCTLPGDVADARMPGKPMTIINRLFLGYVIAVGLATGLALVAAPQLRDFRVSPFFWVVIAMALFELAAFARGKGAPGSTVSMEIRLLGFALAVALMAVIPTIAGSPGRLF